jgi:flavin-dependent dehydrogenase
LTPPETRFDADVAVAGGGPAGAAAAITLARRGRRVILLEREAFPRFHIGESLLAAAHPAFDELGVTEKVRAADFPVKWGARLLTCDGASGRAVDFSSSPEVPKPQTWQVCREKMDQILLDHARESGADVRERRRVTAVAFETDGVRLDVAGPGGASETVRARAVVDATGRAGLLSRQLDLRVDEPLLANVAIYSHYEGVPRLPDDRPGDIRIVARADAGWFWLIPIDARLTSVGVVLPRALYDRLAKGSPEAMLEASIADTPAVADLMEASRRAWPVRVEKDYSYGARAYSGDRWLLAGDAGSFLDPVFSSGVSIALESGIEAGRELDAALAAGDLSARRFREFDRIQRRRFAVFRRFVLGFYTPWFRDLFFSPEPPKAIFRAVVTILAGQWRVSLKTRLMLELFFLAVAAQRRLKFAAPLVRRDAAAGYPGLDLPEHG